MGKCEHTRLYLFLIEMVDATFVFVFYKAQKSREQLKFFVRWSDTLPLLE